MGPRHLSLLCHWRNYGLGWGLEREHCLGGGQLGLDQSQWRRLGAYIAQMTEVGEYPRIALGTVVMSTLVVATNRLVWRRLYTLAERRIRLD